MTGTTAGKSSSVVSAIILFYNTNQFRLFNRYEFRKTLYCVILLYLTKPKIELI